VECESDGQARRRRGNGGEPARKPAHAHAQANRQSASDVSLGAPRVPPLPGDEAAGTREGGAAAAGRLRHVGVWSAGMWVYGQQAGMRVYGQQVCGCMVSRYVGECARMVCRSAYQDVSFAEFCIPAAFFCTPALSLPAPPLLALCLALSPLTIPSSHQAGTEERGKRELRSIILSGPFPPTPCLLLTGASL
jgi:hypothetical protein